MTRSDLVDVMLMSASCAEVLVDEGLFEDKRTPAIRLNDTTDIWGRAAASQIAAVASFATASWPTRARSPIWGSIP